MTPNQRQASAFRKIPPVNALMERAEVAVLARRYSRSFITELVREAVDSLRREIAEGTADDAAVESFPKSLPGRIESAISRQLGSHIAPVLNATGVIVHTNLGRSPLPAKAVERVLAISRVYSTLEYRLEEGVRGSRLDVIEAHLRRLFPGTRGLAVNNNAGAVLLALNTLAEGREVLISRGELVEIGGSFRIPDVMSKSGAILHEVGTTNRTRIRDFETAWGPASGLLLKVHTSNYRIVGFVEEASLGEMAALARGRGIPVMVDQGSGNLLDLSAYGLADEPSVSALLEAGADVVTFSGDKLLGGPQAGIVVGREELVARMKANPLFRALRPDKTTIAALEATLEIFVAGEPLEEIPTLRMLSCPSSEIRERSLAFIACVEGAAPRLFEMEVREDQARVGGGAAPMQPVSSFVVALRSGKKRAEALEISLRRVRPPVISRVREGWLLLDLRTIPPESEETLLGSLLAAVAA